MVIFRMYIDSSVSTAKKKGHKNLKQTNWHENDKRQMQIHETWMAAKQWAVFSFEIELEQSITHPNEFLLRISIFFEKLATIWTEWQLNHKKRNTITALSFFFCICCNKIHPCDTMAVDSHREKFANLISLNYGFGFWLRFRKIGSVSAFLWFYDWNSFATICVADKCHMRWKASRTVRGMKSMEVFAHWMLYSRLQTDWLTINAKCYVFNIKNYAVPLTMHQLVWKLIYYYKMKWYIDFYIHCNSHVGNRS